MYCEADPRVGLAKSSCEGPGPAWGILAAAHVLAWRIRPGRHVERIPPLIFATAIGAGMAGILCWAAPEAAPFIYFQF